VRVRVKVKVRVRVRVRWGEGEDEAEGDPTGGGKGGNDEQRDFDVARAISADCAAVVEEKAYPNEGRITRRKIVFI
jgi:hypothetical protein